MLNFLHFFYNNSRSLTRLSQRRPSTKRQQLGSYGLNQTSNKEASFNSEHDATTTMFYSEHGGLGVMSSAGFPSRILLCTEAQK